jgi:hypothetical protein
MMVTQSIKLSEVSMITNNFGDAIIFADILQDWFRFLGGKPGEVVVVDCGSDRQTHNVYWQLFQEGLIDKLQVIQSYHEDNYGGVESGYIKEYTAGAIASKPYLLWFHVDTLPYREGHDNWLDEAINYLDRDDVFAVGGSFNIPSKHHDAWHGWYFSHKCSLNFALMKRSTFMTSVHEFAGDYIMSGFKGENPAAATNQERYLLEVAFEQYIQAHGVYTLCKVENQNWTVFHTNTHEERLKKTREKYLARTNIKQFMNAGFAFEDKADPFPAGMYYGQPPMSFIKKLRISLGKSPIGPSWRWFKQQVVH